MKFNSKLCLAIFCIAILFLVGCSSSPKIRPSETVYSKEPAQRDDLTSISLLTDEQSSSVTIASMSLVGTPYRYGGNTPETGFDCSGFITYVYKTHAQIKAPRTTAKLNDWGVVIPKSQLRSGDIVLFGRGSQPTHAGIYVGNNQFVHAPSTGGVVRLDRIQSKYWTQMNPRFRRPSANS